MACYTNLRSIVIIISSTAGTSFCCTGIIVSINSSRTYNTLVISWTNTINTRIMAFFTNNISSIIIITTWTRALTSYCIIISERNCCCWTSSTIIKSISSQTSCTGIMTCWAIKNSCMVIAWWTRTWWSISGTIYSSCSWTRGALIWSRSCTSFTS